MALFTKGTWIFKPRSLGVVNIAIISDIGERIGTIYGSGETSLANARLSVKAPVMYDLLNKAFHILRKNAENDPICREIDECLSEVDGAPARKGKLC